MSATGAKARKSRPRSTLTAQTVAMRVMPTPPPPVPQAGSLYRFWAAIAARLASSKPGTWVELDIPAEALATPHAASSLVCACRRIGFHIAIRWRAGGFYVLRGRPITPTSGDE